MGCRVDGKTDHCAESPIAGALGRQLGGRHAAALLFPDYIQIPLLSAPPAETSKSRNVNKLWGSTPMGKIGSD
jgi:hypothetical protein